MFRSLLLTLAVYLPAAYAGGTGKTLTSWDCCKPACAWSSLLRNSGGSGQVAVCDINDEPFPANRAASVGSGCDSGDGFLCSDFQPRPIAEDLSYGFAITKGSENCCKCFELQWLDGPAQGKRMHVQAINSGGDAEGDTRDFIILVPGGGVGPNPEGCEAQHGYDWGRQYGGVTSAPDCETLPDDMLGGCYWRFNWANGDINTWPVQWDEISCPSYLTETSGCSA